MVQGSLLDDGPEVEVRPLDGLVERTALMNGAWFDIRRGWIGGAQLLFERLREGVQWKSERRQMYDRVVEVPRLVAHYDDSELPDRSLLSMCGLLRDYYRGESGSDLRTVGLCLYRDGRDSVAWHGDRLGRGRSSDVVVAIVSFGQARPLMLRPRGGGPSVRLLLGSGDLFVMGGSCQRTWEHCVPKVTKSIGPRISVQFRPSGVR